MAEEGRGPALDDGELLDELEAVLSPPESPSHSKAQPDIIPSANGDANPEEIPEESGELSSTASLDKIARFYEKYSAQTAEVERLEKENGEYRERLVTACRDRDAAQTQIKDAASANAAKVAELERKLLSVEYEAKAGRDRAAAADSHHRKAAAAEAEKTGKAMAALKATAAKATAEMSASVIKFATREAEILNLRAQRDAAVAKADQADKERAALASQLRGARNEKHSLQQNFETKDCDLSELRRDMEKHKSLSTEADIRVKVAKQHVADVEAAHKDTRVELEQMRTRLKEAKEEAETIRRDSQNMLKQIQDTAEVSKAQFEVQSHEITDQQEIHRRVSEELEMLKKQHKATLRDQGDLTEQLRRLQAAEEAAEEELGALRAQTDTQSGEIVRLSAFEESVLSSASEAAAAKAAQTQAEGDRDEALQEAGECRSQAESLLALNSQLSQTNSDLTTKSAVLEARVKELEEANGNLKHELDAVTSQFDATNGELSEIRACSSAEISSLKTQFQQQLFKEQALTTQLEDETNAVKILKKKHAANVRELKTELSQMKRRLETLENNERSSGPERASASSRCSSAASLAESGPILKVEGGDESPARLSVDLPSVESPPQMPPSQAMIEKIVKLQRHLARRTEKIEFLEEHVRQLLSELQKKARIIQNFALREESGALAPESADLNKLLESADQGKETLFEAQIAARGHTAMSAVFGKKLPKAHSVLRIPDSGQLTLELSLEMNAKLQAVLEDALHKNITLKDSMDTLGAEISRLSRENRDLRTSS